jgi:DNA-binding transcriptional LysR family regulator
LLPGRLAGSGDVGARWTLNNFVASSPSPTSSISAELQDRSTCCTRLLTRTTRSVALTDDGAAFLKEARLILAKVDRMRSEFRDRGRKNSGTLRVGAIDTAAAGLMPLLLHDFRTHHPEVSIHLLEEKTIKLLPRLMSGSIDLAFVRPPEHADRKIEFEPLFHETAVVAVPARHQLSHRKRLSIETLAGQPMIVPDRRSRPHSHDLTIKLFGQAGVEPTIAQVAEEKQTIVNLVAAEIGLAIVPRWTSRIAARGVRYIPLLAPSPDRMRLLPLAAAWLRGTHDPARDALLAVLRAQMPLYASEA